MFSGLAILAAALLAFAFWKDRPQPAPPKQAQITSPAPQAVPVLPRRLVQNGTVSPGQTATALLGNVLSPRQIHDLSQKCREVFPLTGLCAGQPYRLSLLEEDFESFEYDIDRDEQLVIRAEGESFVVERKPIPYEIQTEMITATLTSSLFEAVSQIGENPELALKLADIFAWDIDFIRDIREGDSFRALVEKRFRDQAPAGYGSILAAEFINQGHSFQAILFQDGNKKPSYYDPDGNSIRKTFLKAPLSFSRISSGFTMRRYHPITKTWKAHPAIDYAAPEGTPIKSVGDGTIVQIGRTEYNGNFIKIRNGGGYETLFLHMSRFARGMKQGKRIDQGQVIGYVGSTGLATGPHLCFRMYKNGSPVNPNKVVSSAAAGISKENLPAFKERVASLIARLTTPEGTNSSLAHLSP